MTQPLLNPVLDAPQHGFGACDNLLGIEGFDDIVVSAGVQAPGTVCKARPGCEHYDRNIRFTAQNLTEFHSIEEREHQVKHDQIGGKAACKVETRPAIMGDFDRKSLFLQEYPQPVRDGCVIFNNQYQVTHCSFS